MQPWSPLNSSWRAIPCHHETTQGNAYQQFFYPACDAYQACFTLCFTIYAVWFYAYAKIFYTNTIDKVFCIYILGSAGQIIH